MAGLVLAALGACGTVAWLCRRWIGLAVVFCSLKVLFWLVGDSLDPPQPKEAPRRGN